LRYKATTYSELCQKGKRSARAHVQHQYAWDVHI
jgi:hypothetical protein